jgi:uncharacterized protein (TIGR03790 family)
VCPQNTTANAERLRLWKPDYNIGYMPRFGVRRVLPSWLALSCAMSCAVDAAAGGPENVLILANANSATSRSIAEYYARKRRIPQKNVCVVQAPDKETITREEYDRQVASPVGSCLKSRGLTETVLYIVTTLGVPLRISETARKTNDNAAVDSELTRMYVVLQGQPPALPGYLPNPFFRQRDATFRRPAFPMYMVTRLAAYDFAGVKALIDRCDGARNIGKFVLDQRAYGTRDGDEWLRDAAVLLPEDRVVFEETSKVVYGARQVIGYASWGSNDRNRKSRRLGFEWLPGAIATEYVSSNGRTFVRPPDTWTLGTWQDPKTWFMDSPQSLAPDIIAEGASGASGHVDEPYLHFTPRPDYLFPAYAAGRNLAESYYISIPALSWQNIVIGDPLCSIGPLRK